MQLNQIADFAGARKKRLRVGRGIGSGKGKTCGRGYKGQKSRTGVALKGFEGGQMPLHRRLPKRGFTPPQAKRYAELTMARLEKALLDARLTEKKPITEALLVEAGIVRRIHDGVRLIGGGALSKAVTLEITGVTTAAKELVEQAGGKIQLRHTSTN